MSTLEKMTEAQVSAELSVVTYEKAIKHYKSLKESFLNQYAKAAQLTAESVEKMFKEEIIDEINSEGIDAAQGLTDILFDEMHETMIASLETSQNKFKALSKKEKDAKQIKKRLGDESTLKAINEILGEQQMFDMVFKQLKTAGIATNGVDISDILNQMRSYRNRVLLIRSNASAKHYKKASKGYYKEMMVYSAFSKLNDVLGKKVVMHTGSKKNAKGKDTVYDLFIDFFNSVEGSFSVAVNEPAAQLDTGFGVQSKSWSAPWEKENQYGRYSMGGQAALLNLFNDLNPSQLNTYAWIKGVKFLENHLISAIGPRQTMFTTGSGFYWTYELISNFRQKEYFYAFVFNKEHKATSSTSWQKINTNL